MENNNEILLSVKVDAGDAQKQLDDLEKKFDAIMADNGKSKTFAELTKQMEEVAMLSEEFKKHNLEGTSVMTSLNNKAKELNGYAENISKEFGELSNNTFDNISEQVSKAAIETEKFAHSVSTINHQTNNSNQSISKFHGLMEFGDKVMSVQGLSGAFSQVADVIGYSAQGLSEYASASGQAEKAVERAEKAQQAVNKAVSEGKDATELMAKAQEAQTLAVDGTTKATKTFKTALATIGIGLVVLALDMLITNWDKVKAGINSFLPVGAKLSDIFGKLKEVIFGVGNVIIQYLLTPIKSFIKLIQGDFMGAINQVKNGYNVVGNYKSGSDVAKKQNADDKESKRLVDENKELEKSIEVDRAKGINTRIKEQKRIANEIKNAELQGNKEALEEARHKEQVLKAGWQKQDEDKAKQARDQANNIAKANSDKRKVEELKRLEEAKRLKEEALKLQAEADKEYSDSLLSDRDRELKDLESKYEKEYDILVKHNLSSLSLTENYNAKVQELNDKYNKQEEEARNKRLEDERKLLFEIEAIKTAQADLDVAKLETQYDNERAFKIENELKIVNEITAAKIEAEMQAFEEQKIRLGDNQSELELLEKEHQLRLTQIENQASKDRRAIKKREKDEMLFLFDAIGNGLDQVAGEMTENSLAQKSMAVASATISTLTSIAKTWEGYASMGPWGVAGAIAQSAAIAAMGAINIKKILAVKVNGKTGNSSAPSLDTASFANATAPIVDAQEATRNNDVRITNGDDFVVKAYITDGDLDSSQKRKDFLNNISGY